MRQGYPYGTPDVNDFHVKHRDSIRDTNLPNHKYLATVYTCGGLCDRLEYGYDKLIQRLPKWLETGANDAQVLTVYKHELTRLLRVCNKTLESVASDLKTSANALGDEKVRHSEWLDQANSGVPMTKEQTDQIKRAIVKGRSHAIKKLASGSGGSSYKEPYKRPMRAPSRNPTVQGPASYQGAVTRAFPNEVVTDPFAPIVQEHRATHTSRRNTNVDFRIEDGAVGAIPPRGSILGTPPGEWVPGAHRRTASERDKAAAHHKAARAKAVAQAVAAKARAAAAALLYADDRRRDPPVAADATVRPTISQEPPRDDSVAFIATSQAAYIATSQRSFSPRREPSRGARSDLIFHPQNPCFVWSHLEQAWVAHDGSTETTYRGARSRSPPPRPDRDPRDGQYRVTW